MASFRMAWPMALLASLTVLAGCVEQATVPDPGVPSAPAITSAPLVSYLHDLSPVIDGLSVVGGLVEQYRVPVDEGVTLDAWIVRPDPAKVDGRLVPLVLTITPYYAGGSPVDAAAGTHSLGRLGDELVSRGYAVGVSSVRGTGLSGGCFTQGGAQEARDHATVIQHLASQPWSNGNVGLIGVSYDGTTPQDAWVEAPEALKTIVPVSGISDLYKYNFVNGVPINIQGFGFNTYYWALVGLVPFPLGGTPNDPVNIPGSAAGEACADQASVQEGGASSTLDSNKDAYWQERDFAAELAASPQRERASVLYVHGLQDWNVKDHHMEGWLPAVQATGVPFKALLGQWGHAWPQSTSTDPEASCAPDSQDPIATCRNDWWSQTLVAWFDQFLLGRDTGILDAPAVQVQDDAGVWRHEADWPPTATTTLTLHPDDGGRLGSSPGSGEVSYFDGLGLGLDSPAGLPGTVAFVSEPVERDLHVAGLPRIRIGATADANRASLILTLAVRDGANPTIERSINFAAQSLNHVGDPAAGATSIANQRQEVDVAFFPADDVVRAGERIVLYASGNTVGSDAGGSPSLQPVSDGAAITLHLEGAVLELPIDETIVVEQPQPFDAT